MDNLKRTQEQLVAKEKMASLGALVVGIAHEINSPVGVGVTAATYLSEVTTEMTEKHKSAHMSKTDFEQYLDIINNASKMIFKNLKRASELVKSFKQLAVDQTYEEKTSILIKNHLNNIVWNLAPDLNKTRHTISINCDENLKLQCFSETLTQIFMNLIFNSLRHGFETMDQGEITIDVEEAPPNFITIRYHDNGKGIPIEDQKKVFDPFFTTSRGTGGAGLGLHIIYNLVSQKIGGSIILDTKVKQGATFVIQLPRD